MALLDALFRWPELEAVFSDASCLQAMLDFEGALARAEAACGVIPVTVAAAILPACDGQLFDLVRLCEDAGQAGNLAIPMLRQLTALVEKANPSAAGFVHWGATSQDVTDTALVLLLGRCRQVLEADHHRVLRGLRHISDEHAHTVMLGRTLLQPAPPITFGLKAAGWLGAVQRADSVDFAIFRFVLLAWNQLRRQWQRIYYQAEPDGDGACLLHLPGRERWRYGELDCAG